MNQASEEKETTHEVLCNISGSLSLIEEQLGSVAYSLERLTDLIEKASGTYGFQNQYGFIRNAPIVD